MRGAGVFVLFFGLMAMLGGLAYAWWPSGDNWVAVRVDLGTIPIHPKIHEPTDQNLILTLHGDENYELLFTGRDEPPAAIAASNGSAAPFTHSGSGSVNSRPTKNFDAMHPP